MAQAPHPTMPTLHPSRQIHNSVSNRSISRRSYGCTVTQGTTRVPLLSLPSIRVTNHVHLSSRPRTKSRPLRASTSQPQRATNSPARTFKTIIITDSIMRHINTSDKLGANHHLQQINKRDSSSLDEVALKQTIKRNKPDYVYVHLGINDIFQRIPPETTLQNFVNFKTFVDSLPGTILIISLPLFTKDVGVNSVNVKFKELRTLLAEFVDFTESQSPLRPLWQRKLWGNNNHNLTIGNTVALTVFICQLKESGLS